jgi:predicted ArsR family transcriptional regulator
MAEQGFAPSLRTSGDRVDLTLEVCPFVSAVLTDADTVCQIHLGIAQGLADAVGGIEVRELVPKDPRRAHCHLRCRLTDSADAADAEG